MYSRFIWRRKIFHVVYSVTNPQHIIVTPCHGFSKIQMPHSSASIITSPISPGWHYLSLCWVKIDFKNRNAILGMSPGEKVWNRAARFFKEHVAWLLHSLQWLPSPDLVYSNANNWPRHSCQIILKAPYAWKSNVVFIVVSQRFCNFGTVIISWNMDISLCGPQFIGIAAFCCTCNKGYPLKHITIQNWSHSVNKVCYQATLSEMSIVTSVLLLILC